MTIDDDSRHVSYYDSDDYKSDQYLTEGWYRFVTRRHMNTNCGNRYCNNYCNTQYIGWLNGDHPSVEDGVVSQQVCFSYSGCSCSYYTYYIKVLNCCSFYVHKLKPTPTCNLRNCTQ